MEVGEEINGVRLLDVREISGGILEQVAVRHVEPKSNSFRLDRSVRKRTKPILNKASEYDGSDLAGLCAHLGAEHCSSDALPGSLGDILQQCHARGMANRTLLMFIHQNPETVEAVDIDPIDIWFEPVPDNSFPEGIPNWDESFVESQEPENVEHSWWNTIKIWGCLLALLVMLLLFVVAIINTLYTLLTCLFGQLFCSMSTFVILFFICKAMLAGECRFVVPGGIVTRKTKFFKSRFWVTSYDRERSLMVVRVFVDDYIEHFGYVTVSRKGRKTLAADDLLIQWQPLLAAWFSPLPAPTGDKLDDLR